ncbi:ABC transporter permease [Micromonospora sp. NBC_01699]|uniref:ABC transporter permease n=1 Tax=Micromonospora sp. NBC_01699 TaxID=2975984 RepID=UPI002E3786F8|nr:ABC transporter permease [Micromonospora sp. NBC_01699]
MIRTILWKVASAVAVLWGAATVSFLTLHLVPGDPANVLLGGAAATSSGLREQIIAEYGFDDPVPVQYLRYLGKLLTGDLGQSYQQQLPVSTVIGEQLGATVELTVAATVVSVLLATVTATLTAGRRRPGVRGLTSGLELFALSMPAFWLGTLLLAVFSFRLGLFPVAGDAGPRALVLPTLTLALPIAGILAQTMRDGMDTALAQPFAVTARARGLGELAVRARHALRHALLPAITLSGWFVGNLFSGTVLVESVFARPGLGRVTLDAINGKDIPVVAGVVLVSALVFVVISALSDVLYRVVDPRLRSA